MYTKVIWFNRLCINSIR